MTLPPCPYHIDVDANFEPTLWLTNEEHPAHRPKAPCRLSDTGPEAWALIGLGVDLLTYGAS